jgi:putative glutamine amidotransferase
VVDHVLASPLQVLNVALGGTLHPHVPGHRCRERPKGTAHEVDVSADSHLARAVGADRVGVNSLHHQTVDRLGGGLRITARSITDGEVEAIELDDSRPVHGVQWHPELLRARDEHLALFARLVEAAGG